MLFTTAYNTATAAAETCAVPQAGLIVVYANSSAQPATGLARGGGVGWSSTGRRRLRWPWHCCAGSLPFQDLRPAAETPGLVQAGLIVVYANSGRTASLVAKYRPEAPILTLVVPQLRSTSISWTMEGRSIARQFLIVRGELLVSQFDRALTQQPVTVLPQLRSASISWTMEGCSIARQHLIVRGELQLL